MAIEAKKIKTRVAQRLQYVNAVPLPQSRDQDERIAVVYRDLDTGRKVFARVDEPEVEFYVSKEGKELDLPVSYVPLADVDKVKVKHKHLLRYLAELLGQEDYYRRCVDARKFYELKQMHLDPNLHGSDVDVTDHYIAKALAANPADPAYVPDKGFYDIEVDSYGYGSFPDEHEAPCPVNIVTFVHSESDRSVTFVLRDPDNPLVGDFERRVAEEGLSLEIARRVSERTKVPLSDCEFRFYDTELDLLKAFFDHVNEVRPDFMCAYNDSYDCQTLIGRIEKNGERAEDVICPGDFPFKRVWYNEDTRNQDIADSGSHLEAASYSVWVCMMRLYASLRKTGGKKDSYALDAVGEDELGVGKLPMPDGESVVTLCKADFEKFAEYNVQDVALLAALERKNQDVDLLYTLGTMTRTRYHKAMKKTVCLRNLMDLFAKEQGWVMSNNHNATYGAERPDSPKFRGAFVADPNLNARAGTPVSGRPSKFVFDDVIDMDLASLYPSTILTYNIDASTQYGKLTIEDPSEEDGDAAYRFVDSLVSRDWAAVGKRWFGLPLPEELLEEARASLGG